MHGIIEEWAALVKLSQMLMLHNLMEAAINPYHASKNPRGWPEDVMLYPRAKEVQYVCDHLRTTD